MDASALNKHYKHSQGFSLLEVMVALVIMGLVIGTLLQLYGSSMRSVALADEMSYAVLAAESQLARVGREIKVEQGRESGKLDGSDYEWSIQMEPTELMPEQKELNLSAEPYKVTVTIEWESDRKQRAFTLSSVRFGEPK